MQFLNGPVGFGPNLILDGESAEQFPFGDDIENCLSLGHPGGRRLFNFWWHYHLTLGQQTRSTDSDALAAYLCLCPNRKPNAAIARKYSLNVEVQPIGRARVITLAQDCSPDYVRR
jgi:hypothetical protein